MALRNTFEIRHYGKGSRWRIPRILGKLQPIPNRNSQNVSFYIFRFLV